MTKLGVTDTKQRVLFNITQLHDSLLTILILRFDLIFIVLYLWLHCQSSVINSLNKVAFFIRESIYQTLNLPFVFDKIFSIFFSYEADSTEIVMRIDENLWLRPDENLEKAWYFRITISRLARMGCRSLSLPRHRLKFLSLLAYY